MFTTKSSTSIHLYLSELNSIKMGLETGPSIKMNGEYLSNLLCDIPIFPKVGPGINFDGTVVAQRDVLLLKTQVITNLAHLHRTKKTVYLSLEPNVWNGSCQQMSMSKSFLARRRSSSPSDRDTV